MDDDAIVELRRALSEATNEVRGISRTVGMPLVEVIERTIGWIEYQSDRDALAITNDATQLISAVHRSIIPALTGAIFLLHAADRTGQHSENVTRAYCELQLEQQGIEAEAAEAIAWRLPLDVVAILSDILPQTQVNQP